MVIDYKDYTIETEGFDGGVGAFAGVAELTISLQEEAAHAKFTSGGQAIASLRTEEGKTENEMRDVLNNLAIDTIKNMVDAGDLEMGKNYEFSLMGKQFVKM